MRRSSALVLGLFVAVAVVACGDDSASTTTAGAATPVEVVVTVSGGAVAVTVDGASSSEHVSVSVGSQVHLTVTSDVADEVHLHTYDLMVELEAGVPGAIDFAASIPGIFEVELEGSALHLIDLEVG